MREEFYRVRRERIAIDELAGVDKTALARFGGESLLLEPLLQPLGAGEHLDTLTLSQPVPRLLPDHARAVFKPLFRDGTGGYPQFIDLVAALRLVLGRVPKPEEIAGAAAMVVVEVAERNDSVVVAPSFFQVGLQLRRKIASLVAVL